MSSREDEGERVPYMPSEMLAPGENHPTVTKALALKRFCWCGAIAFARGRKGYLLWIARTVRVGLGAGSIDGRNMARGGRVVERIRGGGGGSSSSSSSSSVWTEYTGMVDGELEGRRDG